MSAFNCGMQRDVNIFRQNELWSKNDDTSEPIVGRKFTRLPSVSEAMEAVSRGVKRKISWWRKDSAFPGGDKSRLTNKDEEEEEEEEEEGSDGSDVAISSSGSEEETQHVEFAQPAPAVTEDDLRDGLVGAPLTRCKNTRASEFKTPTTLGRSTRRVPIARPILPPVGHVGHRVRRLGQSAYAAMAKTPNYQRAPYYPESMLSPAQYSQAISDAIFLAQCYGRFDEGRRDRHLRRALGNNTTPAAQWKASIKHVIRAKTEKESRDKRFAKIQREHDFERLCGDVQKRSWRWHFSRGRSQVRVLQNGHQTQTRSAPNREKSPAVTGEHHADSEVMDEAIRLVSNILSQRGLPLTP